MKIRVISCRDCPFNQEIMGGALCMYPKENTDTPKMKEIWESSKSGTFVPDKCPLKQDSVSIGLE